MGESAARKRRRRPRSVRWAAALDERLIHNLRKQPPQSRVRSFASRALVAGSALVVLGVAALFVSGVLMLVLGHDIWHFLGVALAATAVFVRPRWPRVPDALVHATRADQPKLFELVDSVADASGAPHVDVVAFTNSFGSSCGRRGLRRQVVLTIGVPLWAALHAKGRVALLAECLTRLVSSAPSHELVTVPALSSLGRFAELFSEGRADALPADVFHLGSWTLSERIGALVAAIVCAPAWLVMAGVRWLLGTANARTRQRVEYHADALALPIAGTGGVEEYLITLLLADPIYTAVRRWMCVGADLGLLTEIAEDVRDHYRDQLDALEQASIRRRSSLRAEHAPLGRRLQLVRAWPWQEASVPAAEASVDAADRGLGSTMHRAERALAHQP